jgi:transposase
MDRQTLRDWVHRYNAEGLAGLSNRKAPGARPRLTAAQKAELVAWVEQGPDPEQDGVVRWRRIDLKHKIETLFGVEMHERTVSKQLAELGFVRLSLRPRHPKADEAAQTAFKKTSPTA